MHNYQYLTLNEHECAEKTLRLAESCSMAGAAGSFQALDDDAESDIFEIRKVLEGQSENV